LIDYRPRNYTGRQISPTRDRGEPPATGSARRACACTKPGLCMHNEPAADPGDDITVKKRTALRQTILAN